MRRPGGGQGWRQRGRTARGAGLRPAGAFFAVAAVLLAVSGKAAHLVFVAGGSQPDPVTARTAPWPRFEIADRGGRALAVSVECFDLTVSPRAMWRSHTPARMARLIARALGDATPDGVLERALPPTVPTAGGRLARVNQPALLHFDARRAARVEAWLRRGALQGSRGKGPIDGLWLAATGPGTWTLEWDPVRLLSEQTRARHLGAERSQRPDLWTRRLLGDLAQLVKGVALPPELARAMPERDGPARRQALRDAIWAELCPTTFRVVRKRLDPLTAHAVSELCRAEAVSSWQLELRPCLDRRHPVRPRSAPPIVVRSPQGSRPRAGDEFAAALPTPRDDAFAVLGHWGVLGPEDALERARAERDRSPAALDWWGTGDPVAERAWELQTQWRPLSGLELLCSREFTDRRWEERLEEGARSYTRRTRQVARDRRRSWDGRVPNYFEAATDAADVPRFESTLDCELQAALHTTLVGLLQQHDAAVAQAIAVEVETGDVLAVDGVYGYRISGFAPIRHAFTPGSTMKAVTMAIALDQGVVAPQERFATYVPGGIVLRDGQHQRHIHEAEGAPDADHVTAEQGLAQSVNAVLVQIGTRVPAAVLRGKLIDLGYGRRPGVGLGPETPGHVPRLRNGTWRRIYEHASVSFGHELGVSLWQHAAALATIARGGVQRPLRMVRAVEQGHVRWELPLEPGRRVLSARACAEVRRMLALGALEGTGEDVASPERCPGFAYLGTKTGTTERVDSEVSLHVAWPRQLELGRPLTRDEHAALRGLRNGLAIGDRCYTSSMCALGRLPGSDREVLVLVVVDEPRSGKKFGIDVAGPAAISLLRRAYGLRPDVGGGERALLPGQVRGAFSAADLPWAEAQEDR